MAHSIQERRELKQWGGELISFAPTPGKKFGVSDEHIWAAHITAHVETSDGGSRVTATRVATLGVFALGAKKKRPDAVTLVLTGDDYAQVVDCGSGAHDRAKAELFAGRVNAISRELDNAAPDGADHDEAAIAAVAASVEAADPLAQIKQLAELKDAGAITVAEFEAKKAELLDRL
jgi:hypothetical protein